MPGARRSKFGAIRTEVDGIVFASKAESRRYAELKLLEKAGEVFGLVLQPSWGIYANERTLKPIAHYVADFSYTDKSGKLVVEDVKGVKTPVYRLKKKLVEAQHGIKILEIR